MLRPSEFATLIDDVTKLDELAQAKLANGIIHEFMRRMSKGYTQDRMVDTYQILSKLGVRRNDDLEAFLLEHAFSFRAYVEYAHKVIKGRWPELEQFFLKPIASYDNAARLGWALAYAREVMRERWPEIEDQVKELSANDRNYPAVKNNIEQYQKRFGVEL